jgi:hypothetical protein
MFRLEHYNDMFRLEQFNSMFRSQNWGLGGPDFPAPQNILS